MISPKNSPRCTRRSTTPTIITPSPAPPPLPPRRASPTLEQIIIPSTSQVQTSTVKYASVNGNGLTNNNRQSNGMNEAQSVMNLSQHTIEIPQISKSNSMQNMHNVGQQSDGVIELSSPETICGWVISYNEPQAKLQNRHLSCPSTKTHSTHVPVKSNTTPNLNGDNKEGVYENVESKPQEFNPLTNKNASVCYENLNMDYIKKLVSEGYSRDAVIKALGITRNNVDMACDILHEFGTKHG